MKSVARNVIYEKRHKKHMISEGYKAEYVGKGNHDVYHKPRLQAL